MSISKRRWVGLLGVGLFCMVVSVCAQTSYFVEANKTIVRLGAQADIYYVSVAEPLSHNCSYGNLYITSARKGLYTQLLAAKLSGRKLSRIDYSQPGGAGDAM